MKIEDNHYTYRIETKDPNGGSLDFVDIDTVEPLRCAYDVQDELNLETNEHIKRVEEIVLDANSTEFWYVDEARTSDTHLVCYFEEVELMASKDHPMVDTNRSVFEYGKINSNEHQDTNFICTHVMDNGVSRLYMSIDKETFEFATFNNETIKHFISNNPVTVWYALRYEVIIPRSMSKGHLLTLSGQTDITLTTTSEQAKLPIMKFNIGDTQYTLDTNPIHINNTQEGTQIRNIVLEGNTPINYARGNGVNTTEATSDTRYDFEPFYDGQATIQGTVEGGYVSAKLYGDTMVNIAKPYGETPLLTATNENTLCDDLLDMNEEGIVLADGEITEGRIYGDSVVNKWTKGKYNIANNSIAFTECEGFKPNTLYTIRLYNVMSITETAVFDGTETTALRNYSGDKIYTFTTISDKIRLYSRNSEVYQSVNVLILEGDWTETINTIEHFEGIGSVTNPSIEFINANQGGLNLFDKTAYTPNVVNTNTGEVPEGTNIGYWTSDFIPVFSTNTYTWIPNRGDASEFCFYDANKNFVEGKRDRSATYIPPQDGYVRFVFAKGVLDTLQFGILDTLDVDNYKPYVTSPSKFTSTHTLNKLPNGVADYIDVVNKVYVQRVGKVVLDGTQTFGNTNYSGNGYYTKIMIIDNSVAGKYYSSATECTSLLCNKLKTVNYADFAGKLYEFIAIGSSEYTSHDSAIYIKLLASTNSEWEERLAQLTPITILYELKTPIYTPLTDEEIAQLPLSAYADGYVNLSSDQLMPSFEFRMRASNRYQVDMLETGYYYLNAPVGNVKLGTANVDVQQMPCIVKVDNVGTGDSGYRLGFGGNIMYTDITSIFGGFISSINGIIDINGEGDSYTDFIKVKPNSTVSATSYIESPIGNGYGIVIGEYNFNKGFIKTTSTEEKTKAITTTDNTHYVRVSYRCGSSDSIKKIKIGLPPFITLAKLPSHRIPTTFTQGMKCVTDFGYWEGIIESSGSVVRTNNTKWEQYDSITIPANMVARLNRIEVGSTIVEDELDLTTGKFTKRVEGIVLDGSGDEDWKIWNGDNANTYMFYYQLDANGSLRYSTPIICDKFKGGGTWSDTEHVWINEYNKMLLHIQKDRLGNNTVDALKQWLQQNPIVIYYALAVPKISYIPLNNSVLKTPNNGTILFVGRHSGTLNAQVKPSHLTYPVPSLVGNRTYTVVHNRKNITGSTKPITLDLGGTQVELNDASSKTLVKTPSTLAHNNLIFIGGESTVDHIMVLDGDWTNKPIEYFENMMGHDTDAIITIIGNGQINDVAEQYLW